MKFQDLLVLSLSLTTTHALFGKLKGVHFPFPPQDLEDLVWVFRAIPQIIQRSWPINELLEFWPPRFALFISDARHPWITKHYLRLNSQKDVTRALCTLDPSDPSRESLKAHLSARGFALPPPEDLFSRLEVDNNRAGVRRPGWQNAVDRLKEILACPAALAHVKSLDVDIYAGDSKRSEMYFAPTATFSRTDTGEAVNVAEVSALFAQLFSSAPKLERLSWKIPCRYTQFFERDFDRMGVMFENIRLLKLGAFSDYMVLFAPGLESLETGEYWPCDTWEVSSFAGQNAGDWLVKAVQGMPLGRRTNITRLDFKPRDVLTIEMVTDITHAMPNLTELSLDGNLDGRREPGWGWDIEYKPGMERVLQSYLTLISRLPNLRALKLPAAFNLRLGFDGGAWCGNAYDGPGGRAYGRSVARQGAETVELAAGFTLHEMPYLSELSIGGNKASINATALDSKCRTGLTTNDGGVKVPEVRWPWTGRMEQWTWEVWPEPEPGMVY
ncbi:hypothetical protein V8F20_009340 [Naviculisporaceae sp. PSN 640]